MAHVARRHMEDRVDMMLVRVLLSMTSVGVEAWRDRSVASIRRAALMQTLVQRWELVIRVIASRWRYRPTVRVRVEAWDTTSVVQRRS